MPTVLTVNEPVASQIMRLSMVRSFVQNSLNN